MAQRKGQTGNPNGRPKGIPNKATQNAREAIAKFVEGNIERLNTWLDDIAKENPKDAFNAFMSVVEYHTPKLARSELANPEGEAFKTVQEITAADKEILNRFLKTKKEPSK